MYGYHSANKFKVRTLTIDISGVGKVVSGCKYPI